MIGTSYLPFWFEQTGIRITREVKTVNPQAQADSNVEIVQVYQGLARLVDISNNPITVDEHAKQILANYCAYLDRSFQNVIMAGDKIEFNNTELGANIPFNLSNQNKTVGYIRRITIPQSSSAIGSLECYFLTNN